MAFNKTCNWQVKAAGSNNNGGGFSRAGAIANGYFTDGAATAANTSAPVFSSASYSFVAGDVDDWVYINAGANSIPGFYRIASVAGGAATLDGTIGLATLNNGRLNTVAGCATVSSPTGLTFGIDRSRRTAAYFSYTDIVVAATTTDCTSVIRPFTRADVGSVINMTGGAGITLQRVEIVTVTAGVARMDKSLGTAASVGTGEMGGCLATVQAALTLHDPADMWTYVQGGATYTINTGLTSPTLTSLYDHRLIGYTTVPGDQGKAVIQATAGITLLTYGSGVGLHVHNIDFDGNNVASTKGISIGATAFTLFNSKVQRMAAEGVDNAASAGCLLLRSEITGCGGTNGAVRFPSSATMGSIEYCWIHDNTKTGIYCAGGGAGFSFLFNLITNNTGASSDGISIGYRCNIVGNVIYGNGRDGIRGDQGYSFNAATTVHNNILANNGGYGRNLASAPPYKENENIFNNAYYNNASGSFQASQFDLEVGGIELASPNDPFVDAANDDYRLNNTAGRGALLRAAGFPGAMPGLAAPLGYRDIGVYQHQDPATPLRSRANMTGNL